MMPFTPDEIGRLACITMVEQHFNAKFNVQTKMVFIKRYKHKTLNDLHDFCSFLCDKMNVIDDIAFFEIAGLHFVDPKLSLEFKKGLLAIAPNEYTSNLRFMIENIDTLRNNDLHQKRFLRAVEKGVVKRKGINTTRCE